MSLTNDLTYNLVYGSGEANGFKNFPLRLRFFPRDGYNG